MVRIFKNIGIGDLLVAIRRLPMSDVYIGRTLIIFIMFMFYTMTAERKWQVR